MRAIYNLMKTNVLIPEGDRHMAVSLPGSWECSLSIHYSPLPAAGYWATWIFGLIKYCPSYGFITPIFVCFFSYSPSFSCVR